MKRETMIRIKFHSIVDVITNSSTVIYTYQNSVSEAKDLVSEVLKLAGVDKTPDDVFYYGVFCDEDRYLEDNDNEDIPKVDADWGTDDQKAQSKIQEEWLSGLQLSIMKGEVDRPKWMSNREKDDDYGWDPDSYLCLVPKEDQYKELGKKIQSLLCSPSSDGGRDG